MDATKDRDLRNSEYKMESISTLYPNPTFSPQVARLRSYDLL